MTASARERKWCTVRVGWPGRVSVCATQGRRGQESTCVWEPRFKIGVPVARACHLSLRASGGSVRNLEVVLGSLSSVDKNPLNLTFLSAFLVSTIEIFSSFDIFFS